MTKKNNVVFAPWRMEFILGKREKGCVFCNRVGKTAKRRTDRKDLILYRGKFSFVILNKFPYNNGHLMIVPNRHICELQQLSENERKEMFALIVRAETAMKKALHPQGFNMGMNVGKAAGAGIDDHLHFHMVPRWFADTNFWPVIGDVKSMPQHLMETYDRLKEAWV